MPNYNVGDKVVISIFPNAWWNWDGKMNKWCGEVMTIREIGDYGEYKMEEDKDENGGNGWTWRDSDFVKEEDNG